MQKPKIVLKSVVGLSIHALRLTDYFYYMNELGEDSFTLSQFFEFFNLPNRVSTRLSVVNAVDELKAREIDDGKTLVKKLSINDIGEVEFELNTFDSEMVDYPIGEMITLKSKHAYRFVNYALGQPPTFSWTADEFKAFCGYEKKPTTVPSLFKSIFEPAVLLSEDILNSDIKLGKDYEKRKISRIFVTVAKVDEEKLFISKKIPTVVLEKNIKTNILEVIYAVTEELKQLLNEEFGNTHASQWLSNTDNSDWLFEKTINEITKHRKYARRSV